MFENQLNGAAFPHIRVFYNSFGTMVKLDKPGNDFQYMHSRLAFDKYAASPMWKGSLFRLHSPSEHTIDGGSYDMEISIQFTKELAVGTMPNAVLSVLFSVESPTAFFCTENCTVAIDAFFDSLELDKTTDPYVDDVLFADAFMHFDTNNRFAYIGSNS